MITYSTNWMGPISMDWFRERGLTEEVEQTVDSEMMAEIRGLDIGDAYTITEVTTYYSGGRIDIRGVPDEPWGLEYGLPPMHGEDWNDFSDWLESFQTHELWEFDDIITQYENATGRKIRWWVDE